MKAALTNRWDLMNARAQVVDAWRQLKVTANALMGVATVQYNLQATTPPTGVHPLAFSSAATNQQLTLDFQLPLNRVAQRNAYRAAQIAYQVSRRNLMSLEDNIAAQVRFDVRQLQLFTSNYRIQKKALQSLYAQVDSALEVIVAPTDPDALKASGTAGQAAAAALTSQYLTALGQLNGSQTKMYDIWLSLLATRMQLYLDLERLPLNDRGAWIDRGATPPAAEVGAEMGNQPVAHVGLPMSATVNREVEDAARATSRGRPVRHAGGRRARRGSRRNDRPTIITGRIGVRRTGRRGKRAAARLLHIVRRRPPPGGAGRILVLVRRVDKRPHHVQRRRPVVQRRILAARTISVMQKGAVLRPGQCRPCRQQAPGDSAPRDPAQNCHDCHSSIFPPLAIVAGTLRGPMLPHMECAVYFIGPLHRRHNGEAPSCVSRG